MYRTCSSKEKQNTYTHIKYKYSEIQQTEKEKQRKKKQKTASFIPITFYWPLTLKLCRFGQRVREAESGGIS